LPSGAVRLVRLSALTRSSILRTASLEFDIVFLLDVYFLIGRQRAPGIGTVISRRTFNRGSRWPQTQGPRSPRHPDAAANRHGMAFGMPAMTLSRRGGDCKCRKHGQLDILVFGMPKIYSNFFC
jgi:hypothetical protein